MFCAGVSDHVLLFLFCVYCEPLSGRLDHFLLNILDIKLQGRRRVDDERERLLCIIEDFVKGLLGGEVGDNRKVDFVLPFRMCLDDVVGFVLRSYRSRHGEPTLCKQSVCGVFTYPRVCFIKGMYLKQP